MLYKVPSVSRPLGDVARGICMRRAIWIGGLSCAITLLMVFRFRGERDPDLGPPSEVGGTPSLAAQSMPVTVSLAENAVRAEAPWRPDGRLWVRVANEADELLEGVSCGWGAAGDRQIRASAAVAKSGDWLCVDVPHGEVVAPVLVAHASGYLPGAVTDLATDRRHQVVLRRARNVALLVRDIETGKPIAGAVVSVSGQSCVAPEQGGTWIPGCDPANAIYTGQSAENGQLVLGVPGSNGVSGEPATYCYDAVHENHIVAARVGDRLDMRSAAVIQVEMQMPMVGAIRYSGGDIYESSLSVAAGRAASEIPAAVSARLASLRKKITPDKETVGLALLPYWEAFHGKVPPVRARVVLRRGGARSDDVVMHRLVDYVGPQVVVCDPGAPEIVMARVLFQAPADFANGLAKAEGLPIRVSGKRDFGPRITKFGDTIELPVGRYRLGFGAGWTGAFEPDTYEVSGPGEYVFPVRWKVGAKVHVVNVQGVTAGTLAQLKHARDRKFYIADAFVDKDGKAVFWLSNPVDKGELYVIGFLEEPVVFVPSLSAGMYEASCAVGRPRRGG